VAGVWHLLGPSGPDGTRCRSASGPPQLTAQGASLEIDLRKRLPGGVPHDEARVVMLLDGPGRREAAHGSDNSVISALRRKRRSAILRRRVAMGQSRPYGTAASNQGLKRRETLRTRSPALPLP